MASPALKVTALTVVPAGKMPTYDPKFKAQVAEYVKAHSVRKAADKFGLTYHAAYGFFREASGKPAGGTGRKVPRIDPALEPPPERRRDFGSIKPDDNDNGYFIATWWDKGNQRKKRGFKSQADAAAFLESVRPEAPPIERATSKRKYHDDAFRARAIALASEVGSVQTAAAKLGIRPGLLSTWRHKVGAGALVVHQRAAPVEPTDIIARGEQHLELISLREENEQLWALLTTMRTRRSR